MTYELAKQLKDIGFPQDGNGLSSSPPIAFENQKFEPEEYVYLPTLSELIEACPKEIPYGRGMFYHFELSFSSGMEEWTASYAIEHDLSKYFATGSTPEEVVAKLFIALNKDN
jgi:hypothetical protein